MSTPAPKGRDYDARATAQAVAAQAVRIEAAGILQRWDFTGVDSALQPSVISVPHGLGYAPSFIPQWRVGTTGPWQFGNRCEPGFAIGANGANGYHLAQEWLWSADATNIILDWYGTLIYWGSHPAGPILSAREHFASILVFPIPGGNEA